MLPSLPPPPLPSPPGPAPHILRCAIWSFCGLWSAFFFMGHVKNYRSFNALQQSADAASTLVGIAIGFVLCYASDVLVQELFPRKR